MSRLVARALLVLLAAGGWLAASSASGRAVAAGSWTWPVAGADAVSRPFAPPAHRYGAGHRGVDLLAPPGAAVRAAGAGQVSYAGLLAGRGVVVVVHGALRTTYEPVAATVRLGQRVTAGEVLGRLEPGHAGCPAPACLHWGLRRGEDYLDPTRLVVRGPVRLLPVPAGGGPAVEGPGRAPPPPNSTAPRAAPRPPSSPGAPAEVVGPRGDGAAGPPLGATVAALGLAATLSGMSLHRTRR